MKLGTLFAVPAVLASGDFNLADYLLPSSWGFCAASSQMGARMGPGGPGMGPGGERIVGGGPAEIGTWPFMVRLQFGRNYLCGGSLIDGTTILTAAHCCFGYRHNDYAIIINDHFLFNNDDGNFRVKAKSVEYHKDFSWMTFKNDLCVFKLEQDVSKFIHHQFPCLPPKGYEFKPETKCYVAGWGLTASKGKVSPVLKSVNVNIIEDNHCKKLQDHSPEHMICAGAKDTGGRDACQGDSGGPLLCEIDGMVVLAGITSWGIGCAQADHPGEWAKISNYIDWIEPHLTSGKIQNQMTRLTTTTATTTTTTKKAKIEYSQSSRLRIRRYCSSDTPNAELSEYTDINVGMIGKAGKFDIFLQKITQCYIDVKRKVLARVSHGVVEREEELLDTFGQRQVCIRAKQRKHIDSLPCMEKCNKLFVDLPVKSLFNKKDKTKILYWSKLCRTRAMKDINA